MTHATYSLRWGLFVFGDAQEEACGACLFPCAHFVCCWGVHSSPDSLLAGTLLLFWSVQMQVHLFSLFVRVVLLCLVDFSPTSPNSGAKVMGGFLRSKKSVFPCLYLFSALFSCFFFLFHWRARDTEPDGVVSVGRFGQFSTFFAIFGQVGNTISPWGKGPSQEAVVIRVPYDQGSISVALCICSCGLAGVMQLTLRATWLIFAFLAVFCPIARPFPRGTASSQQDSKPIPGGAKMRGNLGEPSCIGPLGRWYWKGAGLVVSSLPSYGPGEGSILDFFEP